VTRQEQFSVFQSELDGHPLVAMIDMSLRDCELKASFPWFLSISTPLINPNKNALTSDTDASALNAWEDSLENAITAECRFVYVGRVTWNGSREVLYYVDKPETLEGRLKGPGGALGTRAFAFCCERDEKWDKISVYFKQSS
jgi:hypothetical protein